MNNVNKELELLRFYCVIVNVLRIGYAKKGKNPFASIILNIENIMS